MTHHHIGFTGTRKGMTLEQREAVHRLLASEHQPDLFSYFHHGDCIGADAQAHLIARSLKYLIIGHPPKNPSFRANCDGFHSLRLTEEYRTRNRAIVNECTLLIAAPAGFAEERLSGTWTTIRFAVKAGRPVRLIMPDGRMYHR